MTGLKTSLVDPVTVSDFNLSLSNLTQRHRYYQQQRNTTSHHYPSLP